MPKEKRNGLRTWIEVDREAVAHNYRAFRSVISKRTKLLAVVKSNAYGHSLLDFSKEAERLGADFLGVDSVVEALALRKEGVRIPILVLGYTVREMIPEAAAADIALSISSFEGLAAARGANLSKPLKIHIKADTGMHRQGFLPADLPKALAELSAAGSKLVAEGLYTHFAAAKNPAFPADTMRQIAEFRKWIDAFAAAGRAPIVHAAATAGTLLFPDAHFDMVRIGIGLYGLYPAREVKEYAKDRVNLRPALSWKAIIGELKDLPAGARIGYDFTETLPRPARAAVLPVGYWHGYPRSLSSIGRVLAGGKPARVLGRVSMDMIVVDVTGIPKLKVEDEVTLLGRAGEADASAETVAALADSSWYEILTRLNPLIKRFYV